MKNYAYPDYAGSYATPGMGDLLGDLLGDVGYDISTVVKKIGEYGATKEQAVTLYNQASKVINMAVENAGSLPGSAARDRAKQSLLDASGNAFDDPVKGMAALKKAAIQCYIEFNSVAEGNSTLAAARGQLYTDLINNAKAVTTGIAIGMGSFGLAVIGFGILYFGFLRK